MPLYEYRCETVRPYLRKLVMSKEGDVRCPNCKGQVRKLMSPFSYEMPDEVCGKLPKGEQRELCTECKPGGTACPLAA